MPKRFIDVTRIGSATKELEWTEDEWDCSGGSYSTPYVVPPQCKRCSYCYRMSEVQWGNCAGCGAPL